MILGAIMRLDILHGIGLSPRGSETVADLVQTFLHLQGVALVDREIGLLPVVEALMTMSKLS